MALVGGAVESEGRREKKARRGASSPGVCVRGRKGPGWPDGDAAVRAQLRPAFGAAAFFASSWPPSTLRLRREEEENKECRRDTSGELMAAQDGDNSRRRRRTTEPDSRVRVRVSGAEEMVRGERGDGLRGPFDHHVGTVAVGHRRAQASYRVRPARSLQAGRRR